MNNPSPTWPPAWVFILLVIGLVIVGMFFSADGRGFATPPVDQQDACHEQLGAEWEPAAVAYLEDWDVAHVQCERSTGFLRTETQWVDVPTGGESP